MTARSSILLPLLIIGLTGVEGFAQTSKVTPPVVELVHLISSQVDAHGVRIVVVESKRARYRVLCNTEAESCITPVVGTDYRFVTRETQEKPTLEFLENWYVKYPNAETVGLVPNWPGALEWKDGPAKTVGIYWLDSVTTVKR